MLDISFLELVVVAVVALIVLGPERLPVAIRVMAVWLGRMKRSYQSIREEIEKEINVDDIRRDLHNEAVMANLKQQREKLRQELDALNQQLDALTDTAPASGEPESVHPNKVQP